MTCFECGRDAHHQHHVVPRSRGGTKTVPLCVDCHSKAHDTRLTTLYRRTTKQTGPKGDPSQAATLRLMGYSVSEIAETLGFSSSTIQRYLRHA